MAEFEQVWDRIRRHAGAEFHTVQGLPFTYEVPGSYLVITRNGEQINRSLSRTNFRKAAEQMPVSGPCRAEGPSRLLLHLGDIERQSNQRRRMVSVLLS